MSDSDSNNNPNTDQNEQSWTNKKFRQIIDYFFNFCFFFFPGAVSKVHQQEATEKYWILWRDVEMRYNTEVERLLIKDEPGYLPHDPKDVDIFVENKIKKIEETTTNKGNKLKKILYFYKILIKDKTRLTRREGHLNMLWRDMTFIRTRMLTDEIIPPEKLPFQLDFCIGEAARLGVQDTEEIRGLIHEAAVELNNTDSQDSASNKRSTRNIVRILTRLNDRRLQRLHEQRMNKLMYQAAFLILLALSSILLYNHEHVLASRVENNVCAEICPENYLEKKAVKTDSGDQINGKARTGDIDSSKKSWLMSWLIEKPSAFVVYCFNLTKIHMVKNTLFFIFFAGLVGGFLSTVMRLGQGSKDLTPGDDAYYAWYVLTKPIVGALGATILYILIMADFAPVEVFSENYLKAIKCCPVGAKGFAFGCIMGFSERIIMPEVKLG